MMVGFSARITDLGALVLESATRMGARIRILRRHLRPQAIDPGSNWDFIVHDVEIHASQFTPAQVESLRNFAGDQRRVYIRDAPPLQSTAYTFNCGG